MKKALGEGLGGADGEGRKGERENEAPWIRRSSFLPSLSPKSFHCLPILFLLDGRDLGVGARRGLLRF